MNWYDRDGNLLSTAAEIEELLKTPDYKRVALTVLNAEGDEYPGSMADQYSGSWVVSTVWLGINHEWNPRLPPLIFETMVFPEEGPYTRRYHTEKEKKE